MGRKSIFGGLALLGVTIAALPGLAQKSGRAGPVGEFATALTRSNCWTYTGDAGAWRKLCFVASGRVKMTNHNRTSDLKGWSECEWSGKYVQTDDKVTVAFAQGSGKCSNRAASPQWSATCKFSGDDLDCEGNAIVDGKVYEVNAMFK